MRLAARVMPILFLLLAPVAALAEDTPRLSGQDDDRHSGYYYPEPVSEEVYVSRAQSLPQAGRAQRVGFVTGFTGRQLMGPARPDFAMFAKGSEAQKLIIVALEDGRYNTLYRARALLAMLTASARALPIFAEYGVEDTFTFFDLAKLLGFTQITISDGETFSHRILLQ